MDKRRVTTAVALIVLICFFLPWVQVSCGSSSDKLSAVDLARDGHTELWVIPLLMLAVLFLSLARGWWEKREISALISLVAGLATAYLMNRERVRAENSSSLIAVSLTGWFWLGLGSAIAIVVLAIVRLLKREEVRG